MNGLVHELRLWLTELEPEPQQTNEAKAIRSELGDGGVHVPGGKQDHRGIWARPKAREQNQLMRDAPAVPVYLVWASNNRHPALISFIRLARDVVAEGVE
ncbi:hypothetical protein [Streptomyces sp. st77]|uniref:hypothetical protein n=1 Tax=Streptomyces sp. st77 TaxID=1828074 RepID=UPI00117E6A18|nr:hypothetical protein [Streptomyces sp. st77]